MKTRVEINNGHAQIILTPENEFERTLIDNTIEQSYTNETRILRTFTHGYYEDRKIVINLEKKHILKPTVTLD